MHFKSGELEKINRAKQKASIAWIVQKAHKNKVPTEFEEPYYRDYEGHERLKPEIVHRLSNADLYCSALANIYGDPNFHNLSHWNIIQALARKGAYVAEPTDVALTETVLIQTSPIKMSAHLAVIEAMMLLYIREVVIAERVVQAIQRISTLNDGVASPHDQEDALVLWIENITQALQNRIHQQVQHNQGQELPVFPKIQDLSDLSDGIGLAALVSFYCSQELSWEDIAVADPPSMADSLYNVGLVIRFCHESLPYNPCLLSKEDIVYMHSSVKQNILAFVAELFFLMELEPVSCVTSAKNKQKYMNLSSPDSSVDRLNHFSDNVVPDQHRRPSRCLSDSHGPHYVLSPQSAHSDCSSYSALSHPHSTGCGSFTGDYVGKKVSSRNGIVRQHSLKDTISRDRLSNLRGLDDDRNTSSGFDFNSLYPRWWWSCKHETGDDKNCVYCLRHRQTQAFSDQFDYYRYGDQAQTYGAQRGTDIQGSLSLGQKSAEIPPREWHLQAYGPYGGGQGISYTLPARDRKNKNVYNSPQRSASMRTYRNTQRKDGIKPAGLPSVRRSNSMNINDGTEIGRMRSESRSENEPSSQNSEYGGRDSSISDGQDGDFVVQRAKGYATLSDMIRAQSSPRPAYDQCSRATLKEKFNVESKEEELGERRLSRRGSFTGSNQELNKAYPAGLPSRLETRPLGRSRSRRNSINLDDSQLTIENFGGSQEHLNYLSRNPDKENFIHTGQRENHCRDGKRESYSSNSERRSASQSRERDFRSSNNIHGSFDELDNRYMDKMERDILEKEKKGYSKERQWRRNDNADSSTESDVSYENERRHSSNKPTSFAEISKFKDQLPGGINIIYMQPGREENLTKSRDKKTSFATLPNQTTWKQQSAQSQCGDSSDPNDDTMEPQVISSELHNVKLKLEEKRRRIDNEKRKMELSLNKQRQKMGKEAFMQAVVKGGKASTNSTASVTPNSLHSQTPSTAPLSSTPHSPQTHFPVENSPQTSLPPITLKQTNSISKLSNKGSGIRPNSISLKEVENDVSNVSKRWLDDNRSQTQEIRTPEIENMDYDEYHKSLSLMTDSLSEIQNDIQRLSQQQHQIQNIMHNGDHNQTQSNQFYLHDQQMSQQGSPSRRMWNQPQPMNDYNMSSVARRAQWGPVRPMMSQHEYAMGGPQGPPQSTGYYSYQMPPQPHMTLPPLNQAGPMGSQPGFSHQTNYNRPQNYSQSYNQNQGQNYGQGHNYQGQGPGFMLHGQMNSLPAGHQNMYQNGQNVYNDQYRSFSAANQQPYDQMRGSSNTAPFRLHNDNTEDARSTPNFQQNRPYQPPARHQKSPSPSRQVIHAPVSVPPPDDMAPQNVSFIESDPSDKLKNLYISSGNRTYRIQRESSSPTRPVLTSGTKTYRVPTKKSTHLSYNDLEDRSRQRSISPQRQYQEDEASFVRVEPLVEGPKADQGFYISLDDDVIPKRPKPPLRTKKLAQKKNSVPVTPQSTPTHEDLPPMPISEQSSLQNFTNFGKYNALKDQNSNYNTYSVTYSGTPSSQTPYSNVQSSNYATPKSAYSTPKSAYSTPTQSTYSTPSLQSGIQSPQSPYNSPYWSPKTDTSTSDCRGRTTGPDFYSDESQDVSDTSSDVTTRDIMSKRLSVKRGKGGGSTASLALVIDDNNENSMLSEMEKKKERLMIMSMRRKQQQEEMKRKKEIETEQKREEEKRKEEEKQRKKGEEKARRELILERHRIKKAVEEAEKEGRHYTPPAWYQAESGTNTPSSKSSSVRMRSRTTPRPRPKTLHEASFGLANPASRGSAHNLSMPVRESATSLLRKNRWNSSGSLAQATANRGSTGSIDYQSGDHGSKTLDRHQGRRKTETDMSSNQQTMRRGHSKPSLYGSRDAGLDNQYRVHESRRPNTATASRYRSNSAYNRTGKPVSRKYRSTGNLYGHNDPETFVYHMSEDSGLGRATPPRRAPSPGMSSRHLTSPIGPGSLPPGLFARRRAGAMFDDNMSDISNTSSNIDYCGPRLFKQPTAKSNRNIILNAVEYCVFPGVVNQNAKQRVLEEIARSPAKYFLILFRDSGCQFRALYSFNPENEDVFKLFGTGPKQITERMFEKFFKYNSGGKCFSQIHTKSLTVTIDAFTIHNSLWQGKRINLPSKKDMKLVI